MWEASATLVAYTGENSPVESVSRGEVEMLQGSCSRPETPSILDTVPVVTSSTSHAGCWIKLKIWENLSTKFEVPFESANEFS